MILDEFRKYLMQRGLDYCTVRAYMQDVRQFVTWINRHSFSLSDFSDADAYLNYLRYELHEVRPNIFRPYSLRTIRKKSGDTQNIF